MLLYGLFFIICMLWDEVDKTVIRGINNDLRWAVDRNLAKQKGLSKSTKALKGHVLAK